MFMDDVGGPLPPAPRRLGDAEAEETDSFFPVEPEGFVAKGSGSKRQPVLKSYDWIVINTSAGKDSQEMMRLVVAQAKAEGVFDRCIALHCDLGQLEWAGTKQLAKEQAAFYGLPFRVALKPGGDILDRVLRNYQARPHQAPWPGQTTRFCTSEWKTSQAKVEMTKLKGGRGKAGRFLNCLGLRAEESALRADCTMCKGADSRAELPPSLRAKKTWVRRSECWFCGGTGERTSMRPLMINSKTWIDEWLPIHKRTKDEIWEGIIQSGVPFHRAYPLGFPRLSCVFCFYAPFDLMVYAGHYNRELLDAYVSLEKKLKRPNGGVFTYLQKFGMSDVLAEVERTTVEQAKKKAEKVATQQCGNPG